MGEGRQGIGRDGAVKAEEVVASRVLVAIALVASAPVFAAQQKMTLAYPERPVRLIVPFTTGGQADIVARTLAQSFSEKLGQQVVVDNRAGSGGVLGMEIAANSPGDGYTLVIGNISTIAVSPALYRKLPYDPGRDFKAVTLIASAPFVMVVPASLNVASVKDFVALAKSRPGKLNYASTGVGSPGHLSGALLASAAGINIVHVPYKGIAPALVDLGSGEVQLLFLGIGPTQAQVKMGKVRAIAVSSAQRSSLMPDLPTVAESGVPRFDITGWYGLFVPVATPASIVDKLSTSMRDVSAIPEIRKRFATLGVELVKQSPAEFAAFVRAETQKWAKVVKDSGMQPE
jgi:tripartite-type tricarboxylate transporter receptor subunit TctC